MGGWLSGWEGGWEGGGIHDFQLHSAKSVIYPTRLHLALSTKGGGAELVVMADLCGVVFC